MQTKLFELVDEATDVGFALVAEVETIGPEVDVGDAVIGEDTRR